MRIFSLSLLYKLWCRILSMVSRGDRHEHDTTTWVVVRSTITVKLWLLRMMQNCRTGHSCGEGCNVLGGIWPLMAEGYRLLGPIMT